MNCTSLRGIYIPNSVTQLGSSAFENCSAATELSLPTGIKEINNFTFKGCSSITTHIFIPSGVVRIGREAFSGCSKITIMCLAESVPKLLDMTDTSNRVVSVGQGAFENMASTSCVLVPYSYDSGTNPSDCVFGGGAMSGVQTIAAWFGTNAASYAGSNNIQFLPLNILQYVDAVYRGFFKRNADPEGLVLFGRLLRD